MYIWYYFDFTFAGDYITRVLDKPDMQWYDREDQVFMVPGTVDPMEEEIP